MLWPSFGTFGWDWSPWDEIRNLRRELNRLFAGFGSRPAVEYPAVSVWSNDQSVVVTAEIPGIDPKDLDVTVMGNTLTLRGRRMPDELKEGETYHRQERGYGQFVRTLQLPHEVDADKVEAAYEKGILRLTLPRAAQDQPRKIQVTTT